MNRKAYRGIRGFEGRIDFLSRYVEEKAGMPRPAAPEGERQRKEPPRVAAASRRRLPHRLKEQLLLGRRVMSVMVVVELEQHRLPVRRAPSTGGLVLPEPRPKKRRLIVPSEPHRPGGGETGHHLIEEVVVVDASVVLQLLKRNVRSDGGWGESARHPLHLLAARLHRQPQAIRHGRMLDVESIRSQVWIVPAVELVSTDVPFLPKEKAHAWPGKLKGGTKVYNIFVVELDVAVEESARLGFTRVRKLVRVGKEETRKLGIGRFGLLMNVPRVGDSRACLELLLLGICRGILHKGLVGVGASDVAPLTTKSAYVQSTRVPTPSYVRSTWSDHPSFMNVPAQLLVSWRLDQHCVSSIKYRAYQVGVRPTASVACQVGGALVS
ncbi:hypothetical protein GW17_00025447 [Ensete ventricosum]|nr:hypothetical protein GW17_00025447 [Ensete ventricosum]